MGRWRAAQMVQLYKQASVTGGLLAQDLARKRPHGNYGKG